MKTFTILLLLTSILPCSLHGIHAADSITASRSMKDGDTLVSSGGSFRMGFFSPGNSSNRYVGIWYNNIPDFTVVWVANRQVPVTNNSAILKLNVHPLPGYLLLVDATNDSNTIWSSPPPANTSRVARNPVLQLLDTGNLVVREEDDPNQDNFYWQSFDYPTDTLLPRMRIGKNLETGIERYLSSWKSSDDPAPGDYTFHCDPTGYPQLMMRNKSVEYFRLGSWNGLQLSGLPAARVPANNILNYGIVMEEREIYYGFDIVNTTSLSRLVMSKDGTAERWWWVSGAKNWTLYLTIPVDPCDAYSLCGAYSTCSVVCECLDKFIPQNQSEWDINDRTKGCMREKNLDCAKGDGFRKYTNLKLPDTKSSWYNKSMMPDACEAACLNNCSCMAYATLDVKAGTGCLFWPGDLLDMKELTGSYQDIYVRMAFTDSENLTDTQSNSGRKKGANLRVILPVIFLGMVVTVLSITLFLRAWKRKNAPPMQEGEPMHDSGQNDNSQRHGEDLELPLFDLPKIHNATSSFSLNNKLGEGGFGSVYKGVLDSGQEIAVKRLSKSSSQGLDEFKNEVICISKLQHRNLVKLLGCCIQGDEKLLIYEFMPNKSLDVFIFDKTKSSLLDWPKRFNIINGIARGLLYLHQDSRLRIIHRDLKASNILLDYDMNPKISDFGIARSFGGNETQASTQRVVGTYGYMSPEYAIDGIFSTKSDVFSFGVLVLEIVSGMRNRGFVHQDHHHNLLGHVWRLYNEGRSLELIEKGVTESCHISEVLRAIQVGLLCVQESPEDRPSMSPVVFMLGSDGALPRPKQPGFFTERNILEVEYSSSTQPTSSVCELTNTLLHGR